MGQIVKPTAPALKAQWAFRCTTAGTASTEPAWPTGNNATITTGGATFTNVTGQSAYFWTAAAGDLPTLLVSGVNRLSGGDRVFISSDHSETQTAAANYGTGGSGGPTGYSVIEFLCVNRAGSTPPAAADLTTGATVVVNATANLNLYADSPCFHYGLTYEISNNSAFNIINVTITTDNQTHYFQNCLFWLNQTSAGGHFGTATEAKIILDNTPMKFGNATQYIGTNTSGTGWDLEWRNTANAVQGTAPSSLFQMSNTWGQTTCRGVDLSAVTGALVKNSGSNGHKYLFDSCKIASAVTRYSTGSVANCLDEVELVNCFDGTNILNERYLPAGTLTTERTVTLSGGATDDVGTFSHKLVSSTNVDKWANTLNSFWLDVENQSIGVSHTATVEIVSSGSLNNDDISLLLEHQGTSGSSVASFVTSLPANVLTANAAVPTSTATWNSSPATPVYQHLQVTFTPQKAGRVRGQVRLGKASTTVYVNPVITIT